VGGRSMNFRECPEINRPEMNLKRIEGVQLSMRNDQTAHVEAITLWQCASGGRDLSKRDYQHVIACSECETLATEIGEALEDIQEQLSRTHNDTSIS
jgi:hypothetical protein